MVTMLCPTCQQPAIPLGRKSIINPDTNGESFPELFRCPEGCQQKVPYPGERGGGDSDWPVEFYLEPNGQPQLVRPAADWFA